MFNFNFYFSCLKYLFLGLLAGLFVGAAFGIVVIFCPILFPLLFIAFLILVCPIFISFDSKEV